MEKAREVAGAIGGTILGLVLGFGTLAVLTVLAVLAIQWLMAPYR